MCMPPKWMLGHKKQQAYEMLVQGATWECDGMVVHGSSVIPGLQLGSVASKANSNVPITIIDDGRLPQCLARLLPVLGVYEACQTETYLNTSREP